jgi:hypothetical protein
MDYRTRVPGLVFNDVWLDVPLDHSRPVSAAGNGVISVFARVVTSAINYPRCQTLPYLVFLQGGPGFASPRPLCCSVYKPYHTTPTNTPIAIDKRQVPLGACTRGTDCTRRVWY